MTFCLFHVHLTYPLAPVLAGGQNVGIKLILCGHFCFVLDGFISFTLEENIPILGGKGLANFKKINWARA